MVSNRTARHLLRMGVLGLACVVPWDSSAAGLKALIFVGTPDRRDRLQEDVYLLNDGKKPISIEGIIEVRSVASDPAKPEQGGGASRFMWSWSEDGQHSLVIKAGEALRLSRQHIPRKRANDFTQYIVFRDMGLTLTAQTYQVTGTFTTE